MIYAERTDTAIPISMTLTKFGLVTGATVTAAIFDPLTGDWLLNWTTGTWQAAKSTETLTENAESGGRYVGSANLTGADVGSTHFVVYYEVTAGGEGASEDILVLSNTVYSPATETKQDIIDSNLDALPAYGDSGWATAAGFATSAALATHDGKLDTVDFTTSQTDGKVDNVQADVDAILIDTAELENMAGATFDGATDSLEAIRNRGDAAWLTGAGGSSPTVEQIDTELTANHGAGAWTTGAGGSPITAQQVRDAMKLAPTGGAPSAGSVDEHLDEINADTADMQPRVVAIEVDTGTTLPSTLSALATAAALAVVDSEVGQILADTSVGGPGPWTTGAGGGSGLTAQQTRDAMQLAATDLTPSLDDQLASMPADVDTELTTQHGIGAWNGVGGGGITPQQVRDSMQLQATDLTTSIDDKLDNLDSAELQALLEQYVTIVEKNAPVVVQLPIVTKDEVREGSLGVVLNLPVMRAGVLADLSAVDSVTFRIQGPESDDVTNPVGSVGTGSEVTWTSDATVFTREGRWLVSALVVWTDTTELWTNVYEVDVQPVLPYL